MKRYISVSDSTFPPAFYGFLNSFAWTLLFLHFALEKQYLTSSKKSEQNIHGEKKTEVDVLIEFFEFMLEKFSKYDIAKEEI